MLIDLRNSMAALGEHDVDRYRFSQTACDRSRKFFGSMRFMVNSLQRELDNSDTAAF
jgi:hypothetical protein